MADRSESSMAPTEVELASWRMWRQLRRLRLAEQASADVRISDQELSDAWQEFCRRNSIDPSSGEPTPRDFAPCRAEHLRAAVARDLRISRWKTGVFGPHAREHYDKRKPALDRVVYSLLRVREAGVARELWFRLKENETTFAELATRYTQGHESLTSGLLGPTALGSMHPLLAEHLRSGEEGKLLNPLRVAEWHLVARVEKFLPAEFDEPMRAAMIEELSQQWLDTKLDESH